MRWLLVVCLLMAGCQSREARYQKALEMRDKEQRLADKIRGEYTEALKEATLGVSAKLQEEIDQAETEEDKEKIRGEEEDRLNAAHEPLHEEWRPRLEAQRKKVEEAEEYARSIKG